MKVTFALVVLVAAFSSSQAAFADVFSYTYTNGAITASGVIDATLLSPGVYGITGGTIAVTGGGAKNDGSGVILADPNGAGNLYTLQNPPNSGGANLTIDNLFYPTVDPQLTDNGFNYELPNLLPGGVYGSIWANGPDNYVLYQGNYSIYQGGGSFAAPDGGMTIMLLGGALVGLETLRRRFRG